MSAFVSAGVSMHLRSGNRPMDWHLSPCNEFVQIHGTLCPDESPVSDARVGFIGDPAEILRELDVARQLVIDHLVATVEVPATMVVERKLLADTLHEGWDTLPSPITHRLKSVLAGDQPEPTGRTTVAALTERQQEHGEVACKRCGKVFGGWAGPAGPDDPDPDEVLGALCSTCSAALASVEAKNARLLTGAGGGA